MAMFVCDGIGISDAHHHHQSKLYIPSGNHTKSYGKSPFFIGKPSINGPFSMAMLNYQRVSTL
jgi:hypothetical protein